MSATETPAATAPATPAPAAAAPPHLPRSGWIEHWTPENPDFWEAGGKRVARRNLIWSIFAEHLGFSAWLLWSVSAVMLAKVGFDSERC